MNEKVNTEKLKLLLESGEIEKIMIKGGCRAYLDSYSDYMNPMLSEMHKAEVLLREIKENM